MATALKLTIPVFLFLLLLCPKLTSVNVKSTAPVSDFLTPAGTLLLSQEVQDFVDLLRSWKTNLLRLQFLTSLPSSTPTLFHLKNTTVFTAGNESIFAGPSVDIDDLRSGKAGDDIDGLRSVLRRSSMATEVINRDRYQKFDKLEVQKNLLTTCTVQSSCFDSADADAGGDDRSLLGECCWLSDCRSGDCRSVLIEACPPAITIRSAHTSGGFLAGKHVFPVDYEAEVSQRLVLASHAGDLKSAFQCIADPSVDVNFVGVVYLKMRKTEVLLHAESADEVRIEYEEFKTDVTPLFLAVHTGNLTLVRGLLSVGAETNQKLFRGYATPAAVREGHREILEILLKAGASQLACEEALLEASVIACCRGFADVVDTLMKCEVDVSVINRVLLRSSKPSLHTNVDCRALVAAVISRQISIVRLLLQAGVRTDFKVNIKVNLGAWSWDTTSGEEFRVGAGLAEPYTVIWCAVEYFEASGTVLRMLLQHHSPNIPHCGRTLIHHAILCCCCSLNIWLVKKQTKAAVVAVHSVFEQVYISSVRTMMVGVASINGFVPRHSSIRLDVMLKPIKLPAGITNLNSNLLLDEYLKKLTVLPTMERAQKLFDEMFHSGDASPFQIWRALHVSVPFLRPGFAYFALFSKFCQRWQRNVHSCPSACA